MLVCEAGFDGTLEWATDPEPDGGRTAEEAPIGGFRSGSEPEAPVSMGGGAEASRGLEVECILAMPAGVLAVVLR